MYRKLIPVLCFMIVMLFGCSEKLEIVEIGNIEAVEVKDGTTGETFTVVDRETLDEIEGVLLNAKLKIGNNEDVSGYKKSISIMGKNTLVLISSERVAYNGMKYSLIDNSIYTKIEKLIDLKSKKE